MRSREVREMKAFGSFWRILWVIPLLLVSCDLPAAPSPQVITVIVQATQVPVTGSTPASTDTALAGNSVTPTIEIAAATVQMAATEPGAQPEMPTLTLTSLPSVTSGPQ